MSVDGQVQTVASGGFWAGRSARIGLMLPETMSAIEDLLNLGGTNYTVFLRASDVALPGDRPPAELVRAALGTGAIIGGAGSVTCDELVREVRVCLGYLGDSGAGPAPSVVESSRFKELLVILTTELVAVCDGASGIEQFWLKAGHPAYPVFWDFAFLVRKKSVSHVLIGSSSD